MLWNAEDMYRTASPKFQCSTFFAVERVRRFGADWRPQRVEVGDVVRLCMGADDLYIVHALHRNFNCKKYVLSQCCLHFKSIGFITYIFYCVKFSSNIGASFHLQSICGHGPHHADLSFFLELLH